MEKQEIHYELDYPLDWEDGVEISKIKKDIEELEMLGATYLNIEACANYDGAYVDIQVVCKRIETDEEFEKRKKDYAKSLEKIKQSELNRFYEIKSKYNL